MHALHGHEGGAADPLHRRHERPVLPHEERAAAREKSCAASTRALPPSFFFHIEQNSQLLRRLCDAWNVLILFQQVNNSDLDPLIMNYIVVDTIYTTNEGEKKLGDMSALNSLVPSSEREQLR